MRTSEFIIFIGSDPSRAGLIQKNKSNEVYKHETNSLNQFSYSIVFKQKKIRKTVFYKTKLSFNLNVKKFPQ